MDIVITGRHVALSEETQGFINERVQKLVRFFDGLHDARVVVDGEGERYEVEFKVAGARGSSFAARFAADDLQHAVRRVALRVEAQIRRHKAKLHPRRPRSGAA